MSMPALLALVALGYALSRKKKAPEEATFRVVERPPELKPLPAFKEDDVFGKADKAASQESEVQNIDQWSNEPAPPRAPSVQVVQPPPEMDAEQNAPESPPVVPIEPGQAAQAAAINPGVPLEEVVRADPAVAARELAQYVSRNRGKGAKLGTKGGPSPAVRALQMQMGVEPADGIYGPQTRAKGESLGVSMPGRT
jgi:hypothetical protein